MKRLHLSRWLVFAVAAFAMNFPVLSTLIAALKSPGEVSRNPSLLIDQPTLENFATVLTISDRLNVYHYLWNSFSAALIGALLPIALAFPVAWLMVRRQFGRTLALPLIVNLRALPLIIFAIPIYMMFATAGLLDTRLGLGLIFTIVNLPLTLLLLVNAVAELPIELEEAATVDGAGLGRLLIMIVLPLCRPVIVTSFVLGFITAWNEFLFGLMLTTQEAVPMTVGASFFFATSGGGVQWGVAAAVMIVAALPPLLLGLVMYRRIAQSMTIGAVKG